MTPNASAGDQQSRSRFQSGLLTWLRAVAPQDHADGLREMIAVTRSLAGRATSENGAHADSLLWRSAGSFLQALLDGSLTRDDDSRALCRRLERHLANRSASDGNSRESADSLADAIFAFASNRSASISSGSSSFTAPDIDCNSTDKTDFNRLLNSTFSATADLLPLLESAKPRRFSDEQVADWRERVAALRASWHAVQTGAATDCRAASTALVQTALDLSDAASLRIAEAVADAAGATEEIGILNRPAFRAAFTATLEVIEHPEGPEQKGFDESTTLLASRLANAAKSPGGSRKLICASAPWFAEDALETLAELRIALDAVPPKRLALLAGLDWFIQHELGKAMAIRGLATTAYKLIGQIRTDDLDEPETHAIIAGVINALQQAAEELAAGFPPKADEEMFRVLRNLEKKVSFNRQQAIAAARTTINTPPPPEPSSTPLQ